MKTFTSICALALCCLLSPVALAAFDAVPLPNEEDRAFERLPDLSLVRGARLPRQRIAVTADAGESWTGSVSYPVAADHPQGWVALEQTAGQGDAVVPLRLDTVPLSGDGPFSASITFTPDVGDPVTINVNISIWPRAATSMSRAELRDSANWPTDSSYYRSWEVWGFLPDSDSHQPDETEDPAVGASLDSWERTPCPEGGPYDETCTRPGQAGLATGMSADAAWLLSTGDPRVVVAVMDSGMRWRERDLVTQYRLNGAELAACPPPGATAGAVESYDVNQDGRFNMRDYHGGDYADVNLNGHLDPQDLIRGVNPADQAACSDGVDDDSNGYVDDICGWDFFWNDNDAGDDSDFGHGNKEAKWSLAEANNGIDRIGICPRCSLLPVRVGDSFIVDVNQFAEGVIFAVDSGASVVQEALGSLNSTPFMYQAIDYAYANGVAVIGAAADEGSYHHNYPATANHVLSVHAIVMDTDGEDGEGSQRRPGRPDLQLLPAAA